MFLHKNTSKNPHFTLRFRVCWSSLGPRLSDPFSQNTIWRFGRFGGVVLPPWFLMQPTRSWSNADDSYILQTTCVKHAIIQPGLHEVCLGSCNPLAIPSRSTHPLFAHLSLTVGSYYSQNCKRHRTSFPQRRIFHDLQHTTLFATENSGWLLRPSMQMGPSF